MSERNRTRLPRQLESTARELRSADGSEVQEYVLKTCKALLNYSDSQPEEDTSGRLYEYYVDFAGIVAKALSRYPIRSDTAETCSKLTEIRKQLQAKEDEEKKALMDLEAAKKSVEEKQKRIRADMEELDRLRKEEKSLDEQMKECSETVSRELSDKNKKTVKQLESGRKELTKLQEEEKRLLNERIDLNANIKLAKNKIDALPKENRDLQAEYSRLENQYNQICNARTECSPEKQQELRQKIDELTPAVEELHVQAEELRNRLNSLEEQKNEYESEKNNSGAEMIKMVQEELSGLEKILDGQESTLKSVKNTADTLLKRFEECRKLREDYSGWLDSDSTPLEAMIRALQKPESENLRKTLDIAQVPEIRSRMDQVKETLLELDKILASCASAAKLDLDKVRRRANA